MKRFLILLMLIYSIPLQAQVVLVKEGETINNNQTGSWGGVNIPRSVPTSLLYRNNSITSVNTYGYMLQAGDEAPTSSNNNLDGEIITGNRFNWKGVNGPKVITHGLFIGYNINSTIKYNYLNNVPYAVIFKSGTNEGTNMTFTSGGCAYNICKNGKFAIRLKGINGVKILNNTFYNGDGSGWYFLLITENMDRPVPAPSTDSKVFNNIFYTTTQIPMIKIETASLAGFECDYNLYWCTVGQPTFVIDDRTLTFTQWKALGYDTHSVVLDPQFIDNENLAPKNRLDYGINVGEEWSTGLSTTATWVAGISPTTTDQNGTWQVGARIHKGTLVTTIRVTAAGGDTIIDTQNGTLQLSAEVLPDYATDRTLTWSITNNTGKAEINSSGLVTALQNGSVTAKATANDGSGIFGTLNLTISNQIIPAVDSIGNEFLSIVVTSDILEITLTDASISSKASLYNCKGELVDSKNVENETFFFEVSSFSPGLYLIVLEKREIIQVAKIIKP